MLKRRSLENDYHGQMSSNITREIALSCNPREISQVEGYAQMVTNYNIRDVIRYKRRTFAL